MQLCGNQNTQLCKNNKSGRPGPNNLHFKRAALKYTMLVQQKLNVDKLFD